MKITTIPISFDNYAFLIICPKTQQAAIIDPSEAAPVIAELVNKKLKPASIINTHHHGDHVGGNQMILEKYAIDVLAGTHDAHQITDAKAVAEKDNITVGTLNFSVIEVPGHTQGHIALYGHGALFCGDALFVSGCGRVFEGTSEEMFISLSKLKDLPDETKVYCAHEYTVNNLEFALTVEPRNPHVMNKLKESQKSRAQNKPTVPSTIGEEKTYNPFLRTESSEILQNLQQKGFTGLNSPVSVFAALRRLKDAF